MILRGTTATWTGVVPGPVLDTSQYEIQTYTVKVGTYPKLLVVIEVGSTCLLEDSSNHVVKVMVRVGIVEALRESVYEDTWIG